jgi:hypothetical protein
MQRLQGMPARLALHLTLRSWHGTQALGFFTTSWFGGPEPAMPANNFFIYSRRKANHISHGREIALKMLVGSAIYVGLLCAKDSLCGEAGDQA